MYQEFSGVLTFDNLRTYLDAYGKPSGNGHDEGLELELVPDQVGIHDHPHSGRPTEIHFMVNGPEGWQKVAEIGPRTATEGVNSEVAPAYINFLQEWDGKPVRHVEWKNRLLEDNDLEPPATQHLVDEAYKLLAALPRVTDHQVEFLARNLANDVLAEHEPAHPSYEAALAAPRVTHIVK